MRFLPSFDFIFINLQKYSDKVIRGFDSIFLQKSLLSFKHHLDKTYLQEHIVELIFKGYDHEITEQMRSFMRMITVYLTAVSGMSSGEIKEKVNKSDNNLKSEAMSIFEEIEQKGIEEGIEKGVEKTLLKLWHKGMEPNIIANYLDLEIEQVEKIIRIFLSKTKKS